LKEQKNLNINTMKAKKQNEIVNREDHLDRKYGKRRTPACEKYTEEFESFKIGVLIQEARKNKT
jgi:hypothetical protein